MRDHLRAIDSNKYTNGHAAIPLFVHAIHFGASGVSRRRKRRLAKSDSNVAN
ncbi:hypothetical protein [Collimonas humicola]|uniref:hypothetical protein n=1 Tax=Collimonas humicola TaxID=2825886 RepID=UPI001B8AC578|nr:hypothetical protein [Collimonas humicola]